MNLPRQIVRTTLIALFALAMLATTAPAARPPSKAEEGELVHAVHVGIHEPSYEVGVELSRVRLSTVAPRWAAAKVSLYVEPGRPFAGAFAIFHRRGGEWRLASYTEDLCGPGAELPIPIGAQRDLKLPSCALDGARLGEEPSVREASGAWTVRPSALRVRTSGGLARLIDLGRWRTWNVNRSARASTRALLAAPTCQTECRGATEKAERVDLTLRGYRHCGSRLTFRWLEWGSVEGSPRVPHRRYRLACR